MTQIQSFTFHPYRFPLKEPLIGGHGRVTERSGWVIAAHSKTHTGFGDIAPWPGFGAGIDKVTEAIHSFESGPFINKVYTSASDIGANFNFKDLPSEFVHGLECAMLDALAREFRQPLAQVLDPWAKGQVRSHRLVSDGDSAAEALSLGFSCLKIKVAGLTLDRDLERVKAIRERIGMDASIRIDANAGWDLETAGKAFTA
ncbi:MAG: enolase C-terminal domain-like protein, partial [Planctomycetota bacterium]|nr:enolase C-terminal domain-like protein [Planctomycetota bacterium]